VNVKHDRAPYLLVALTLWTFAGTVLSLAGIWVSIPASGLLWPTVIHPHWLGTITGALAFTGLSGILQANRLKARAARTKPDAELAAARTRVARVLHARAAQQAPQRPE
jgi:hypothetical protein